jgi:hypothetical protein
MTEAEPTDTNGTNTDEGQHDPQARPRACPWRQRHDRCRHAHRVFARRTRDVRDERAHSSAEMPAAATFIADMPAAQGTSMTTVAITVEGDEVVAYATNGANDEAYFFGTQSNGQMDLTSTYADRLKASFDGKNVSGEIVMNENGAAPEKFAASPVAAPAGIYTAAHDNSRATWVVGPNHTMVGIMVLNNSAPGDHKITDAIAAQNQQFKDRVRQMRLDRQMQPAPQMAFGTGRRK